MTTIKIITATAALFSLALVAVGNRGVDPPNDQAQQSVVPKDIDSFEQHWRTVGFVMLMAAMMEQMLHPPELKVVATEPVAPTAPTTTGEHKVSPAISRPRDICQRHHMRKVYIRGGKSWRCK
jgi:hypothetical protein